MATVKVEYTGGLRTKCTHLKSGSVIQTDAPVDNNGKGETFSPTDLVATAYASCMLTIVGIYCEKNGIAFTHGDASVEKIMAAGPRRISRLVVTIDFSGNGWDEEVQSKVIAAAQACPVAQSVSEAMEVEFNYNF